MTTRAGLFQNRLDLIRKYSQISLWGFFVFRGAFRTRLEISGVPGANFLGVLQRQGMIACRKGNSAHRHAIEGNFGKLVVSRVVGCQEGKTVKLPRDFIFQREPPGLESLFKQGLFLFVIQLRPLPPIL